MKNTSCLGSRLRSCLRKKSLYIKHLCVKETRRQVIRRTHIREACFYKQKIYMRPELSDLKARLLVSSSPLCRARAPWNQGGTNA